MAFPQFQDADTASNVLAQNTLQNVTLPLTIATGDLIFVFIRVMAGGTTGTVAFPSSPAWTKILDDLSDNSNDTTALAYRYIDGSEGWTGGETIQLTVTSAKCAAIAFRVTGAANPATTAPTLSAVTVGTGNTQTYATCNPGVSRDHLWVALAAWDGGVGFAPATNPSGYGGGVNVTTPAGGAVGANGWAVSCYRTNTASSESPGSSTSAAAVNAGWTTVVLGIPPVAAVGPTTIPATAASLKATGPTAVLAKAAFPRPAAAAALRVTAPTVTVA